MPHLYRTTKQTLTAAALSKMGQQLLNLFDFMDTLENDSDDELLLLSRPRTIRDRSDNFVAYDDVDFFKRYRMQKQTALSVLEQINDSLEYSSNRNCSVSPMNQFLITLRYFATGSQQMCVGDTHGVDVSTVSRIVKRVCCQLITLRSQHIMFPQRQEELQRNQEAFFAIAQFPFVVGTIDCTHVKIQSPGGNDAELFRNRKHYFSINVQTVCDPQLKVLNVVARWPGSTHDSAIFTNSSLCREFEAGRYGNTCLLGDSGYPLKTYLLTPYLNPTTRSQEKYNFCHIRTRNSVERQYGVIKRRFPVLALGIRIKLNTAIKVIISCCILHNICISAAERIPPNEFSNELLNQRIRDGQIDRHNGIVNGNEDRRAILTNTFFSST